MSSPSSVLLQGVALHAGTPCAVRFVRLDDAAPLVLSALGREATRAELLVIRSDRGVMVRLGREADAPTVDLVEHLFAALGGLGITHGLRIEIAGGEIPLLDGGASDLARALDALALPASPGGPRVQRAFAWEDGDVRYVIEPAVLPSIEVSIDFAHPAIGLQTCQFGFDRDDFMARIAPARTFGFARDWPALLAQGRARGVDRRSVCVFDDVATDAVEADVTDEPGRHKLLDLLGDCTLLGGPFGGALRASRPGHGATHAFLAAARQAGAFG